MAGPSERNNAIAAAIILLGFGALFYFMPTIVLSIGGVSPIAGFAVGCAIVALFFVLFYVRSKMKR